MTARESLDDLAAEAGGVGVGQVPATTGPDAAGAVEAPQVDPNHGAVAFILAASREVLCAVLKVDSPRNTLADPIIDSIASALAPVATKYGLQLGSALDGPEARAVMVAGPLLWTAYRELARELDAKRKPAPKPEAAAPEAGPA